MEKLIWMDNPSNQLVMSQLETRHLALLTVLSALCIVIQLTPRPLPNFELTTLLVFLIGAFFGALIAGALGATVMFINGFLSPWGFAGLNMPFQIAGMVIVGVVGGLYGRANKGTYVFSSCGETAILGAFLTLVYDIITNLGFAVLLMLSGMPLFPTLISTIVSGTLFSLVHVVSNFFIFLIAFFPLTRVLRGFLGGENLWRRESSPT